MTSTAAAERLRALAEDADGRAALGAPRARATGRRSSHCARRPTPPKPSTVDAIAMEGASDDGPRRGFPRAMGCRVAPQPAPARRPAASGPDLRVLFVEPAADPLARPERRPAPAAGTRARAIRRFRVDCGRFARSSSCRGASMRAPTTGSRTSVVGGGTQLGIHGSACSGSTTPASPTLVEHDRAGRRSTTSPTTGWPPIARRPSSHDSRATRTAARTRAEVVVVLARAGAAEVSAAAGGAASDRSHSERGGCRLVPTSARPTRRICPRAARRCTRERCTPIDSTST